MMPKGIGYSKEAKKKPRKILEKRKARAEYYSVQHQHSKVNRSFQRKGSQ